MSVKSLRQTGDTIVEVLIAMAVAASVLSIAYATSNRNLRITRASQERSEAARLAQGQIEALRYAYANSVALPNSVATPFCFNGATVQNAGFSSGVPNASLADEDFGGYPANCTQGFYHYAVTRDSNGGGGFHFYVRWDNVSGATRDEIIMVYRVK